MRRRLLRPHELRPLLRLRRPVIDSVERRLRDAHTIGDLRRIAQRHTPRAVYDYTDGAADDERHDDFGKCESLSARAHRQHPLRQIGVVVGGSARSSITESGLVESAAGVTTILSEYREIPFFVMTRCRVYVKLPRVIV